MVEREASLPGEGAADSPLSFLAFGALRFLVGGGRACSLPGESPAARVAERVRMVECFIMSVNWCKVNADDEDDDDDDDEDDEDDD